ncbi:MAG: hypothetical protein MUF25_22555, partial [Pirellulaceae bacterium]|nr:hypothetical protein [Pirellulaceae bacterium]
AYIVFIYYGYFPCADGVYPGSGIFGIRNPELDKKTSVKRSGNLLFFRLCPVVYPFLILYTAAFF